MSYKLLLADDSITIQKVVELILSEEDYIITSANNGEEAFEIAKRDKPDIILADIIMPKTDGYQLCEKIKKDSDLMTVPVLLLAGAYESFDTSKASAVGADDYIIKPFESQELIKKVKDSIERGAKPISKEPFEEVATGQEEEDLWESLDLTSKAEITETDLFKGIEVTEETEAIGEVFGEALAEEKAVGHEEEPFPFEAEIAKAGPQEIPEVFVTPKKKSGITIEPVSAEIVKEEIIKIIKETISPTFDVALKDIVEKVSWEVIPDVAERVAKGIIEASITSGFREAIERVAWEVVPDMAEILIKKEIERLKVSE